MTREEAAQLHAGAASVLLGLTLVALAIAGWAPLELGVALVAAAGLTARRP